MASQITSRTIVYSTVHSTSLAPARWNPPHKGQVTRKTLPFDDVIMQKHGYSSKHREPENDNYRLPILESRTMTPNKRCLLLVISLEMSSSPGIIWHYFQVICNLKSMPIPPGEELPLTFSILTAFLTHGIRDWQPKTTKKNNKRKSNVDRVI